MLFFFHHSSWVNCLVFFYRLIFKKYGKHHWVYYTTDAHSRITHTHTVRWNKNNWKIHRNSKSIENDVEQNRTTLLYRKFQYDRTSKLKIKTFALNEVLIILKNLPRPFRVFKDVYWLVVSFFGPLKCKKRQWIRILLLSMREHNVHLALKWYFRLHTEKIF